MEQSHAYGLSRDEQYQSHGQVGVDLCELVKKDFTYRGHRRLHWGSDS